MGGIHANMTEQVFYTKYGIANRFEDGIYLHEGLKNPKYEALRVWLVRHELAHTNTGTTRQDFAHDFADTFFKPKEISKQYFSFYFTHRWAWLQSSPVWLHKGRLLVDLPKLWNFAVMTFLTVLLAWWVIW